MPNLRLPDSASAREAGEAAGFSEREWTKFVTVLGSFRVMYQLAYDPSVAGVVEIPYLVHRSN
jgi:hypothetical protein